MTNGNILVPKYLAPQPIDLPDRQWPNRQIEQSPIWCSVDLRDGNQALPNTMNPDQKLEYFKLLCAIGFKHIEVGFPSASQDDFDFVRRLIEERHIPNDVFIMVLTQCREHLIQRTFESLQGVGRAIVHSYIATSDLHVKQVFNLNREQTINRAVEATSQIRNAMWQMPGSDIRYQFSPEEFTDTDLDFALEICTEVFNAWDQATPARPMILNLPATVERRPPYQVADMFEWFESHIKNRESVMISAHAHNDQGMAVASTEMAILAGADRVEGALLGNGERTGNVDISVVALNLLSRGIEIGLDFSNLPEVVETVQRLTGMPVPPRHPYAGDLVFTAFSGSHQDAIKKGMERRNQVPELFGCAWRVPYLHLDPCDLGREYEKMIRINSQSGKGGIAWVMEQDHGISLPKEFQPVVAAVIQARMDQLHGAEVSSDQLRAWFDEDFVNVNSPYRLEGYWITDDSGSENTNGLVKIRVKGSLYEVNASGNGPIDAFAKALDKVGINGFQVTHNFAEGSLGQSTDAIGIAFMPLTFGGDSEVWWGVGTHSKTHVAAARGIVSALNRRVLAAK